MFYAEICVFKLNTKLFFGGIYGLYLSSSGTCLSSCTNVIQFKFRKSLKKDKF